MIDKEADTKKNMNNDKLVTYNTTVLYYMQGIRVFRVFVNGRAGHASAATNMRSAQYVSQRIHSRSERYGWMEI